MGCGNPLRTHMHVRRAARSEESIQPGHWRALLSSPPLLIGEGLGVGTALWLPSPRRRGVGGEVPTRTAARSARGSPPRPTACAASYPRRLAAPDSRTARPPAGLRPQECPAPA